MMTCNTSAMSLRTNGRSSRSPSHCSSSRRFIERRPIATSAVDPRDNPPPRRDLGVASKFGIYSGSEGSGEQMKPQVRSVDSLLVRDTRRPPASATSHLHSPYAARRIESDRPAAQLRVLASA